MMYIIPLVSVLYPLVFLKVTLCSEDDQLFAEITRKQNQVCPTMHYTCDRDTLYTNTTNCCGQCDCGPECIIHGSCCLSKFSSLIQSYRSIDDNRYRCVTTKYLTTKKQTDFLSAPESPPVWMIGTCGNAKTDKTTRRLCENPGINGLVETIIPVDLAGEHFQNKFCAFCNGFSLSANLEPWRLEINCRTPLLYAVSDEDFLAKVEENRCNIFYRPPLSSIIPLHDTCTERYYTISECNATGLWPVYDRIVETACKSFVDPFNYTYRNYFCYVCNTDNPLPKNDWKCELRQGEGGSSQPPFLAILDLGEIQIKTVNAPELVCDNETQYKDTKLMKCRDILCDSDRYLQNLDCLAINGSKTNGSCYVLFIKLIPGFGRTFYKDQLNENDKQNAIRNALKRIYDTDLDSIEEQFELFRKNSNKAEETIIDYIIVRLLLHVATFLQKMSLSYMVRRLHYATLNLELPDVQVTFRSEFIRYHTSDFADIAKHFIQVPTENGSGYDVLERVILHEPSLPSLKCQYKQHIVFDRLHVCPFIEISTDDLSMEIENGDLIIREPFLQKSTPSWEFRYNSGNGNAFLCLSDYKIINSAMPQLESFGRRPVYLAGPKEVFSFICVCLSIACLLITVITYTYFTELRSQPGINTVILCVCLLLAQAVYQFGAGQTDIPNWACATIGAICHYLWLSVMFAMNVCSYDMFRIFRALQIIPTKFILKDTFLRLVYITGSPLIFVFINVIVSISLSHGQRSGYGGFICYLSSVRMHLITFIIPSATTILVNFILFFYVVIKIGQTRINSAHLSHERNYFGVYARLSTLTGMTWLIGFLQIFVESEVLEYQFILLNAGQGVFIMIAFVFNKRLCKFCESKREPRSSTTQSLQMFT